MRGFTLVELMVTLAVAAILITIAVPSFKNLILSNRLSTVANQVVNSINTARLAAIKTNANTQVCSNSSSVNTTDTLGAACSTNTAAVFQLIQTGSGPSTTMVKAATTDISAPIKLNGDMTAVRFGGDGLAHVIGGTAPYSGTIADICTSSLSTDNHRIITMAAGGSVIETTTKTEACP